MKKKLSLVHHCRSSKYTLYLLESSKKVCIQSSLLISVGFLSIRPKATHKIPGSRHPKAAQLNVLKLCQSSPTISSVVALMDTFEIQAAT